MDKVTKLKKWYAEELERKDRIIEELKKESSMMLKAALKKEDELIRLREKLKKPDAQKNL